MEKVKKKFGLLGKNISYSFSKNYFNNKFKQLDLDGYTYINYDIPEISLFKSHIHNDLSLLCGMNVTIPYKQSIIPFLDGLDPEAEEIGAVNTLKFLKDGSIVGYNTDVYGFEKSLIKALRGHEKSALILGTGGASKAVAYVLGKMGFDYRYVSRTKKEGQLTYKDLTKSVMDSTEIIVNCTPLGTFPNVNDSPNIPYSFITSHHLLYDLIYNPEKTRFLQWGDQAGASVLNGKEMLQFQADKSWEIWNR